jgi:hypothetical protein
VQYALSDFCDGLHRIRGGRLRGKACHVPGEEAFVVRKDQTRNQLSDATEGQKLRRFDAKEYLPDYPSCGNVLASAIEVGFFTTSALGRERNAASNTYGL